MPLPFILSTDYVTLISEGKPHTIYANDGRFTKLKEALKNKNWAIIPEIISLPKAIALFSAGKVQVFDGEVTYNGRPIHSCLTARILEFVKEGFPFEPFVHFMDKLMENPSERSREQLFNYCENYKLPISDSGSFYAVKAVQKDTFLDIYSKTIDNHPGANPKMPREECEINDEISCAKSFHAGNYEYVKQYGQAEDEVVLVEIEPQNVIACPKDCSYQKLRVCEYKVIGYIGKVKDLEGFNSNYAPNETLVRNVANKAQSEQEKQTSAKVIGANSAYLAYKQGAKVSNGQFTITSKDKKTRAFFRQMKGAGWYLV